MDNTPTMFYVNLQHRVRSPSKSRINQTMELVHQIPNLPFDGLQDSIAD